MLIRNIRHLEKAIGHGRKETAPQEKGPRCFKRRGIYAARTLKATTKLEEEDILFYAPSAQNSNVTDWTFMAGKKLKRDIERMELITTDDVE
jgi:sialic acid synthase SpsE